MSVRRRYPSRTSSVISTFWIDLFALFIALMIFSEVTKLDLLMYHTAYRTNTFCSVNSGWRLCARLNLNALSMLRYSKGVSLGCCIFCRGLTLCYIHRQAIAFPFPDEIRRGKNNFPWQFLPGIFPAFCVTMHGGHAIHMYVWHMPSWIWSMHNNCVPFWIWKSNSLFAPHPIRKTRFAICSHSPDYIINPTTPTSQALFCWAFRQWKNSTFLRSVGSILRLLYHVGYHPFDGTVNVRQEPCKLLRLDLIILRHDPINQILSGVV